MPDKEDQATDLLRYIRAHGIVRSSEVSEQGWSREYLHRLERDGLIYKVSRGVYAAQDADISPNRALAEISKRIPEGVICLLSALQYHDLTTKLPNQVWVAVPTHSHRPKVDYPPVRIVEFSGDSYMAGIQRYMIDKVHVQIYSPAKTIADCFRYRSKLGMETVLEGLRAYLARNDSSVDELWRYARLRHVTNTMLPYLEALR